MEIVEHLTGPDYNVMVIDNIIPNLDKYDIESWYDFSDYTPFKFPGRHREFILQQHVATDEVLRLGKQLYEDLKPVLNTPDNTYISSGTHTLSWVDKGVGAIPPHNDTGHFAGVTIFTNLNWDMQWGGWNVTMSEVEDRIVRVTPPKFNRAVIVMGGTLHAAVPVYEDRVRKTLQYFITYNAKD